LENAAGQGSMEESKAREEDLKRLREENAILKRSLGELEKKLRTECHSDQHKQADHLECAHRSARNLSFSLGTAQGTKKFYAALQCHVSSQKFRDHIDRVRPEGVGAILEEEDESSVEAEHRPSSTDDDDLIVIPSQLTDSDPSQVAVVDLDQADWWTVVPPLRSDELAEPDTLDGAFVVVEEDEVVEAIAEFLAAYVVAMPHMKRVPNDQLQAKLSTVFSDFQEKGAMTQLWEWGQFLYTTYGWTATAVGVYQEPEVALWVLRGLWTAAKWMSLFFI